MHWCILHVTCGNAIERTQVISDECGKAPQAAVSQEHKQLSSVGFVSPLI